jgi:ABC-type uncharacterized transport system substrate-binding protein
MRILAPLSSVIGLLAGIAWCGEASAHPHVFVTTRAELVFNAEGQIAAIRHTWSFDEMYTAFAITGFGSDAMKPSSAELLGVAKQNIEDLAEYKYFTVLKTGREEAAFAKPNDYSAEVVKTKDDVSLVLRYVLPLQKPLAIASDATLQVYDPSYFVAFSFDDNGVTFSGTSGRCKLEETKAAPLNSADQKSLTESFFTNMLPGSDFGGKLADRVHIRCR